LRNAQQQNKATDRAAEAADRPLNKCRWLRIFHRRKAVIAQPEPTDAQQRQAEQEFWTRSLRKQRNLNLFTALGVLAAAAAFVTLLFTLREDQKATGYVRGQAEAAATQAGVSQQEFELSERPWVSVDPIGFSDLRFNPNGTASFTIRFLIKNTGHSPAIHAHLEAQMKPIKLDESVFTKPLEFQKDVCDKARTPQITSEFAAFTIFPGNETTRNTGVSMVPGDMKDAEFRDPRPFINPVIVGCIDYQFGFKNGHHQTGFVYALYRIDPRYPLSLLRIYLGDTLLAARLHLEPFAFGNGFYAD